jgi:uncharacterized membrane protein
MNLQILSLSVALLAMFSLSSCDSLGGGGDGVVIKEPTVDQMARLEKEWGMTPRTVKPRGYGSDGEVTTYQAAPQQAQARPQPVAETQPAAAAPTVPPLPDSSTLQKLR